MNRTLAGQHACLWNAEEIGERVERDSLLSQDTTCCRHLWMVYPATSFCLGARLLKGNPLYVTRLAAALPASPAAWPRSR